MGGRGYAFGTNRQTTRRNMVSILIALLSGFMSGVGGVGYKVANQGRVSTLQVADSISILGLAFFTFRAFSLGEWAQADGRIIAMGLVSGLTQYLGIILFAWALKRLPLSLVWCANSLTFMPVILVSWLCFGESMSAWRWLGLAALIGAIAVTSFCGQDADTSRDEGTSTRKHTPVLLMMAALLGMLALLGCLDTCMKWGCQMALSATDPTPLMDATQNVFMALLYLVLVVCFTVHISLQHAWTMTRRGGVGCLLAAIPTVAFFGLKLVIVADAPAAVTFALACSTSMVVAALLSTIFLQEKRTPCWYTTLTLCILAVVFISEVFLLPFR